MGRWDDEDDLSEQYEDASNLRDRITLHERYSTTDRDFRTWQFDAFDRPSDASVLGIGCGPGELWASNRDRIPDDWDVVVTDASPGMVTEARTDLDADVRFAVLDAEALPFGDEQFDAVTAHHMLYHVPNLDAALGEIRRVLAPGGRLYATTNGEQNNRELRDVLDSVAGEPVTQLDFTLENGGAQLREHFDRVSIHRYEDALRVPDVEPLVAYGLSMPQFEPEDEPGLREAFEATFDGGAFHVTKDVGTFVAESGD